MNHNNCRLSNYDLDDRFQNLNDSEAERGRRLEAGARILLSPVFISVIPVLLHRCGRSQRTSFNQ